MAGIINTGSFPKALQLGVRSWFGGYNRTNTLFDKIYQKQSSNGAYEEYWQEVRTGVGIIKPLGQGVSYDSMQQGFGTRITNAIVALGVQISHEEIRDNKYPKLGKARVESLKNSLYEAMEILAANTFNQAFNSNITYGDGVQLASTAHPNFSGGTWSNALSTPADLNETAVEDMLVMIDNATDDRGNMISIQGRTILGAPANKFNAHRILKSIGQSGDGNNDDNAIKSMGELSGGFLSNKYLKAPNAWFILTSGVQDGLIYQEREPMTVMEDNDHDTFNMKILAYNAYGFGVGDVRACYGSNGP